MTCREAEPLLHARLDDELDMASSASIDLHLSDCPVCAAQYAALLKLHNEIAAADLAYAPSAALEGRLAKQFLRAGKSPFRFWPKAWFTAPVMAAAAIGVAALLIVSVPLLRMNPGMDLIATDVLDGHLRALQPMHQVDVPSSDHHTVKPWFQGKIGFSPPVPDLSQDGFVLVGGRLDVIRRQPVAAIVYRRREHVISLYVWPATERDSDVESHSVGGYHLLNWTKNGMSYWAVSDVSTADLQAFANLIRGK